jgi:hypothetical protein
VERSEVELALSSPGPFTSFQAIYEPVVFKIDNFVARSEWDQEQLARCRWLRLEGDQQVPFSSPEDMIIAKCRWFDLGRRVSDRQWNDLVRLYEVQHDALDAEYIEKWLLHFGLTDLWDEIRHQAQA